MNIIKDWNAVFNKTVCQLDEQNVFLYQTTAELDCYAKDGSYLVPANCYEIEPPEIKDGYAAQYDFSNQTWTYQPDHRGKTVYDTATGVSQIITQLGELPENVTTEPRPSEHHTWDGAAWTIPIETEYRLAAESFQLAKSQKIKVLNDTAQQFINDHADQVPEFEKLSWTIQGEEAKAWAKNPDALTPVLDAIAAQRNLPRELLIQAALKKTLQYELLVANTAGQRQALQTRIEQVKTLDELNAIDIVFTLPESAS